MDKKCDNLKGIKIFFCFGIVGIPWRTGIVSINKLYHRIFSSLWPSLSSPTISLKRGVSLIMRNSPIQIFVSIGLGGFRNWPILLTKRTQRLGGWKKIPQDMLTSACSRDSRQRDWSSGFSLDKYFARLTRLRSTLYFPISSYKMVFC